MVGEKLFLFFCFADRDIDGRIGGGRLAFENFFGRWWWRSIDRW
jgi:hypothetical protein